MSLRETQLAIDRWLRAPEGVAKALQDGDAAGAQASPGQAERMLSEMIQGDAALDAVGRLEIYANAYFHRIFGVLQNDFPALEANLGAAPFSDLVTSYLLVEPSRHPSLRFAGARLANFLNEHEAAARLRDRAPWAFELADLEWTRSEVFDTKEGAVLDQASLASLAPEDFGALELRLGAWVKRKSYEYPVANLWRAAIRGDAAESVECTPRPMRVLIWRKNEEPVHRILENAEDSALALAQNGIRFDALCVFAATCVTEDEAPALAASWLAQWLNDGLLRAD
ncbi:MAG: putative DNA-binding domain-containing protein [Myxococcota bacterium]